MKTNRVFNKSPSSSQWWPWRWAPPSTCSAMEVQARILSIGSCTHPTTTIIFVVICFCCEICFVAIHAQLRGEKLSKTYSHGEKLPISVMVKPFGFMCVVSNICKSLKTFGNFWHWWHFCTDGINMIPKYFLDLSELYFEGKKPERSWDITIGWDDLGTRWDCNDVRLDG